jgi:flagellar hook assembly protein FlgD
LLTATPTATLTPQRLPYAVKITAYNAAGEVVRVIYDGTAQLGVGLLQLDRQIAAWGHQPVGILFPGFLEYGQGGISWDLTNSAGQAVSGGIYHIKAEVTDSFGKVTAMAETVQVIDITTANRLAIYNSAGELVRTLDLAGRADAVVDMWLGASVFSPVYDHASGAPEPASRLAIHLVDARGVDAPFAWDGLNDKGSPVSSGVYSVQLTRSVAGGRAEVKSASVQVLANGSALSRPGLQAAPNPAGAAGGSGHDRLWVAWNSRPGHTAKIALLNVAGEQVLEDWDHQGAGQRWLSVDGLASGVYVLVLHVYSGGSLAARELKKVAILR